MTFLTKEKKPKVLFHSIPLTPSSPSFLLLEMGRKEGGLLYPSPPSHLPPPQVALKLGKKKHQEGEGDRQQQIEGISRLICMAKSAPLRVAIDGHEWTGVKFFQLSGQWQTHIKYCPVAIGGGALPGGEQY